MVLTRTRLMIFAGAAAVTSLVGFSVHASAATSTPGLAEARSATAIYHDPAAAKAAGYLPTDVCVADPNLGVMGQHWVNPALFTTDPAAVDPAKPQALLYVPTAGGVKLVAVEYIVFAPGRVPAANPNQVDPSGPSLFGQHFNGLMAGHEPGMPTHWDLHVWLWQHNSRGTFAQFNPSTAISC